MKIILPFLMIVLAWAQIAEASPPDWTRKAQWQEGSSKFYVGVASRAVTEQDGRKIAWENALSDVIQTEFGSEIKLSQTTHSTFSETHLDQNIELIARKVNLKGLLKKDIYIDSEKENGKAYFTVYVLLEYPLEAIRIEQKRLATQRSNDEEVKAAPQVKSNIIGNKSNGVGSLEVKTNISEVEVILDGVSYGYSDILFEKVYSGPYDLTLNKAGYRSITAQIIIEPNKKYELKRQLERLKGKLVLDSIPSGGLAYIDNLPRGQTPLNLELETGEHIIRIERTNYNDSESSVEVTTDKTLERIVQLNPKPGLLTLFSEPSGAEVYSQKNELIGITPLKSLPLPSEEELTFTIKKEGYRQTQIKITIPAGRGTTLAADKVILEKWDSKSASVRESARPSSWNGYKTTGVATFAVGATALGVGLGYLKPKADDAFSKYKSATTADSAMSYREQTDKWNTLNTTALASGSALMAIGVGIFLWGQFHHEEEDQYTNSIQYGVAPTSNGVQMGAEWKFK